MALTWLARRLTNAGLRVGEIDGWRTAGRPGAFAPQGVLIHHTAGARSSRDNPAPSLSTVINGRSDLPGPLCQVLVDYNGVCWVVAAGRTNNAGAARASGPLPATSDGNALYVGIEIDYRVNPDGSFNQNPSSIQKTASIVAAAAIVTRLGHGYRYVRGHKETSVTNKIDPKFLMPMPDFRDEVRKMIAVKGF
ncbi:hypothetical protein GCM10022204_21400 [Microlunatus aurantiacus]|uniref:N-acetylmuramoyl-L-alanine amidase domain-containing protein n=1 Tax=Microlunatus aurantiacus TaxID=446786 RepID=A0ABP7DFR1_9ACTN